MTVLKVGWKTTEFWLALLFLLVTNALGFYAVWGHGQIQVTTVVSCVAKAIVLIGVFISSCIVVTQYISCRYRYKVIHLKNGLKTSGESNSSAVRGASKLLVGGLLLGLCWSIPLKASGFG